MRRTDAAWLDPPLPAPVEGVIFIAEAAVTRIVRGPLGRIDVFCPAGVVDRVTRGSDYWNCSALGIGRPHRRPPPLVATPRAPIGNAGRPCVFAAHVT